MSLEDWDRNVQYEDTIGRPPRGPGPQGIEPDRRPTPVFGPDRRSGRGRGSKPYSSRRPYDQGRSRDALTQARRLQSARDRYIPD